MTIYYLGAEVANVALSDSFNTWRITTNKILADAASLSGNNFFTGTVTFGGGTSVGDTITANNITASSIVRANNFIGDGSLLTNAGATTALDTRDRTLLVPFTAVTSGKLITANVNSTFTFNPYLGQVSANSVKSSDFQDSSGRTLTIRDEANTIVWGG